MKQFSSCGMQLEAHSLMSCLGSVCVEYCFTLWNLFLHMAMRI